jgi:sarcosine oxidase/L-pipecolate oxidase
MQEKLSLLGFNASSVLWFNESLTNRTQSVIINGAVSDPQSIPFGVIPIGVPQLGSILGPLLFIVYINELPSVVKNCNIKLYADDTLIILVVTPLQRLSLFCPKI